MKVTELMIGDWVSYNGHPVFVEALNKSNGYAIEKDMISIKLNDDTCLGINAERLEPLLLTDEIMKKNGFVCETWMPYWYIPYCHNLPYIEIFNNTEFVKDADEGFIIHIQYVHELQHLLKLFKIEKEIVL